MNIATALMSLFEDRLNAAKSLLAPAHDRELVLAIGALFFLFPLSKTVYVLALVLAIVFSVRQANPTPWWDLIRATPLLWFPIAIYLLVLLQAPTSPADTSDVLESFFSWFLLVKSVDSRLLYKDLRRQWCSLLL
ncbi:MAG: hypothetical protein EB088_03160 [Betaproteobacteria bacterium]|nr:hypothetical protein [Betaproteobacteria bacterium]